MPPPLLSRTLDPILGVFTGVFAYYLYETHPRAAIPEDLRLLALLRQKRERWQQERKQKLLGTVEDNVDWQTIVKETDRNK